MIGDDVMDALGFCILAEGVTLAVACRRRRRPRRF